MFAESLFEYPDAASRRPPVPTHNERPQMGTKTTRNFITTNAVTNIMSVPRNPPLKYVDTSKGSQHLVAVITLASYIQQNDNDHVF